MIGAFFLTHWWHFNYLPGSGPWYGGAVWPNVFVIAVVAPLGWLWSRTRFWPLRPIRHALHGLHEKADALAQRHEDVHAELAHLRESHEQIHAKLDALGQAPPVPVAAVIPVRRPRPPGGPVG